MACCFLTYFGDALAGNVRTDFIAYSRNVKLIELCGSDQSRSVKITATVLLDKLIMDSTGKPSLTNDVSDIVSPRMGNLKYFLGTRGGAGPSTSTVEFQTGGL